MADRDVVHPHHLARAVLADDFCRQVLLALDTDPDEVRLTLDRAWLDAADTIEVEEVEARGIELATVLVVLNPPFDTEPDWGGRRLSGPARDVLVHVLAEQAKEGRSSVGPGHVLLALLACHDPIVAATWRAHRLTARRVRPVVARWARRA